MLINYQIRVLMESQVDPENCFVQISNLNLMLFYDIRFNQKQKKNLKHN